MNKLKEFLIYDSADTENIRLFELPLIDSFSWVLQKETIHVIEYSAYEKLSKQLEIAKEALEKIRNNPQRAATWIASEALEQIQKLEEG